MGTPSGHVAHSPTDISFTSNLRQEGVKFGVSAEWLAQNKHNIVPIFISGGECGGVNDYFACAARSVREKGLIPVMVQNGIEGFTKTNLHDQLAVIDEEIEQYLRGVGGAVAGSSRVNLLRESRGDLFRSLENMEGFHSYLAIGGGDHAVFWTTFSDGLKARAEKKNDLTPHDLDRLDGMVSDITKKMIVVYKTIDGDVFGQPLGMRTAIDEVRRKVYASAASGHAMKKVTVIGCMGADVGLLPLLGACRNTLDLDWLEAGQREQFDGKVAQKIRDYSDEVLILIPEVEISLAEVVEQVKAIRRTHGSATVVVAEGFRISESDALLGQLLEPDGKFSDPEAVTAWNKFSEAKGPSLDPHGNVKWAQAQQELIVAAALRKFLEPDKDKDTDIRIDGKMAYGDCRGPNSNHYDKAYATLLGGKIGELMASGTYGVVVSLPPVDRTIDERLAKYLHNRPQGGIMDAIVDDIRDADLLQIHSFELVHDLKRDFTRLDALLLWGTDSLRRMGVAIPAHFDDSMHAKRSQALRRRLRLGV